MADLGRRAPIDPRHRVTTYDRELNQLDSCRDRLVSSIPLLRRASVSGGLLMADLSRPDSINQTPPLHNLSFPPTLTLSLTRLPTPPTEEKNLKLAAGSEVLALNIGAGGVVFLDVKLYRF